MAGRGWRRGSSDSGKGRARSCWPRSILRTLRGKRRLKRRRAGLARKSPGSMKRSWGGGWGLRRRGEFEPDETVYLTRRRGDAEEERREDQVSRDRGARRKRRDVGWRHRPSERITPCRNYRSKTIVGYSYEFVPRTKRCSCGRRR